MPLVDTSQADGGVLTGATLQQLKGISVNPTFRGTTEPPLLLAASGAINPHQSATYVITLGSAAALTLAAPTAGTDDGVQITITSNTAYAHTLTATGLLQTGTATVNLATLAAFAGASISLYA